MTDEQYHNLMCQMRDLGMMVSGSPGDSNLIAAMMERLHRRADESAPVISLERAVEGVAYVIVEVDFQDDPEGEVLHLCNLGFVVGSLVKVLSRSGEAMEIALSGTSYFTEGQSIAIRRHPATQIKLMRFPQK